MSSPLPLALTKSAHFLENRTLGELIDPRRVQALIKSDFLGTVWDENNYSHNYSKQHHSNQCEQLKNFLEIYDPKQKVFTVNYSRGRSAYGRVFPKKALGLTSLSKKIRNTFISDTYYDFDLSNAQPHVVENLCKANSIPCEKISHYIHNREEVLNEICEHYSVTRGCAKKLMLRLCFFGTVKGWKMVNQKTHTSDLSYLTEFTDELKAIAEEVKKSNGTLFDACRKKKEDKKEGNVSGSFFSTYLQTLEFNIVSEVLAHLVDHTKLTAVEGCRLPVATYEFDGLKLLKANVNAFPGGKEAVLQLLTEKTLELTGFRLRWEEKEIDPGYELGDLGEAQDVEKMNGVETDLEAAEKLYKLYPHWVFCEGKLYVFDKDTGLWQSDRTSHHQVIQRHSDYLHKVKTNSKGEVSKSHISYGNTVTLRNIIPSLLETLCRNDNWLKEKRHSSLKKLLFKNGYLDGAEGKFYHKDKNGFNPDIVFFGRIHHDFEKCDEDYMHDIRERIFYTPLGKEQGEYLVQNLARGLMGDVMKRFIFGLGGTNCGKSVMSKAIGLACGDYVGSFNAENLAHRVTSDDEAKNMRWAMLLRHKRLIFSNEMKTKCSINGNMLKKLSSGGDSLIGRTHGEEECEFIPHFLAVAFANDVPKIDPYDDAADGRVRCVNFTKEFVNTPQKGNPFEVQKDENIEQEIQTLAFQKALVRLLCDTYVHLLANGIPPEPEEVVAAKGEWFGEDENPLARFFEEFELTNNEHHYAASDKIEAFFKKENIDISMKKFGGLLNKHCTLKGLHNVKRGSKKIRGKAKKVWFGLVAIVECDDEEEERKPEKSGKNAFCK